MLKAKVICLIVALCVGGLCFYLGVPAGWLMGGLLVGFIYGLYIKRLAFEGWPFRITLSLVGVNIGFMMESELFQVIGQYFLPLLVSLLLTLAAGVGIGWLMNRWTSLDPLTAYFCCVPGGASEIIAISGEYGGDNRVVAAFHTARITFFVLTIPFLAGLFYPGNRQQIAQSPIWEKVEWQLFISFLAAILFTLLLYRLLKVPAGTLLYGILIGFLVSEWVIPQDMTVPSYIGGVGQALIGVMVGIRFDRPTFLKLKDIGRPSVILLASYFLFSLVLAFIFQLMTGLSYMTSLLSTVPAGAAEMSSTAMALHLEPTLVASLHIVRVIALFLFLPILIKIIKRAAEQGSG